MKGKEIELYTVKETKYLIEYYKEKVVGKVYLGNMRILEFHTKEINTDKIYLLLLTETRNQSNTYLEVGIKDVAEYLNLKSPYQILLEQDF